MKVTPQVLLIGGGMIAGDQILPVLYTMQRRGEIGAISVCSQHGRTVMALANAPQLLRAFPGQSFRAYPDASQDRNKPHPDLFRRAVLELPPRNVVVVAVPDQLHFDAVMAALRADQHVICVKPLVLRVRESAEIEHEARSRGLFVGVEYHKRFDDRNLRARGHYRDGSLGEFRMGTCRLMEKWHFRHSNFQNWCTVDSSDAFTYVGCHYVDIVQFITGLTPAAVSSHGIRDRYPNGNEGFLWCDTRVLWNNGAVLNVQTSLSCPDEAPGANSQGMTLYFSGEGRGGMLDHSDQYRGVAYSFVRKPDGPGATFYAEPSPDFLQYNDIGGPGLEPVGYGVRSMEALLRAPIQIERECATLREQQDVLEQIDRTGFLATPANSRHNDLVIEAGRLSILNGGQLAAIDYSPTPRVRLVQSWDECLAPGAMETPLEPAR